MIANVSSKSTDAPERRPGRPRSARAHQAILDATIQLLIEVGYRGLSLEQVAARAGVGKTTIYRRWSSKQDLVVEAVSQLTLSRTPIVDTGDARADILKALRDGLGDMQSLSGQVMLRLMGEMTTTPELLKAFIEKGVTPDLAASVRLIEHAQARGDIRADLDPVLILGMLAGPFIILVFWGQGLPADLPERTLDAVWEGIAVKP